MPIWPERGAKVVSALQRAEIQAWWRPSQPPQFGLGSVLHHSDLDFGVLAQAQRETDKQEAIDQRKHANGKGEAKCAGAREH